jgi:5-methylcytosine-specific restriction enzyme B
MQSENGAAGTCWFVGAAFGHNNDQTQRFLSDGIWENGYQDRYLDTVKSMQKGDRIAIKATYTQKKDLPFDARGNTVSVMSIKATGTITENLGDGRHVKVEWKSVKPPRVWYFYTYQRTIWRIVPGSWYNDALIAFAFEECAQDLSKFRNDPYWRERFGDLDEEDRKFAWTAFYEAMADGLLAHKDRRPELVRKINDLAARADYCSYLHDQDAEGNNIPLTDVCPFTILGIFNRNTTNDNRRALAAELAAILGVELPVPESFKGIPFLNNQKSMFFGFTRDREPGDVDALWRVFEAALAFAKTEEDDADSRAEFAEAYAAASRVFCVGRNLSMALYWSRPWVFATLDLQSLHYIQGKLNIQVGKNGPRRHPSAEDYLKLLDTLNARFLEDDYPVHTFPALSFAAWQYRAPHEPEVVEAGEEGADEEDESPAEPAQREPPEPYSLDSLIAEGAFLDRGRLAFILAELRRKQNLILQGPPGTGKSWLAKRLGYALLGAKDESRLRAVQFHPNMSYEDFVRGFRPNAQGRLELVEGPFMRMVAAAGEAPDSDFVLVIEEINRGNPAQIFGEMLTLMEDSKRNPDEALELCYPKFSGERVYVPKNLYIIGTMNIADRSLALVDLALRRRFAFVELEPCFNAAWRSWVLKKTSMSPELIEDFSRRVAELNATIEADPSLKRQFKLGHSFFTPRDGEAADPITWFRGVVETQVGPLLEEYWYDRLELARDAKAKLLEGL